ncbi:hypothetical protein A6F68_00643 [Tsuneonella dongtanensis]|uniref:Uncharacterized protein n=1 Tax=Tsuneonella dongtanensis TaxID=692370 RepID=A0A1B2AAQ2_9SPHN|nr:hypothetical protein [Tsuneonella dongtanensis]ANY19174.1 hypothetical protein A6F68_00643 [Tsuneonella dongtanensis]
MSIFVERRRPAFTPDLLLRVVLAWAMISALLLVTNLAAILAYRFPDPDDTLRLIQVRDLIAGQSWFDVTQYRIDAANGGVAMHWSRLVDLPIAALILLLKGMVGPDAAEMTALIAIPLLTFGVALLLAGRIAWRLLGDEAAGFACLAMALSVPVIEQLRPMRIDHHGWQIVCALAVMNALMARRPIFGGWIAGLVMAIWLAISIEGLPLVAAICGITAIRWLRDRHESAWFVGTMQGLAAGSLGVFALTRGFGDLAQHCDAISPVHIGTFVIGAFAATGMARLEPLPRFAQLAGFGLIAGLGFVTLQSFAPACTTGAFSQLDPLAHAFWYTGVGEGLSVWDQTLDVALQVVIPPMVALVACVKLAGRSGGWLRGWWHDYALVLLAAFAVSLFVVRAGAVAGALSAVPLGWQVREWLRSARNRRRPAKRALVMAGMALALLPAMPLTLLTLARPAQASIGSVAGPRVSACRIGDSADLLNALPPGEILAPLDIGPQLLLETHHSVVATGHHRGGAGMHTAIAAFLGNPEAARTALAKRGTRYIALCPDLAEPARYLAAAPEGFMADLLDHRAPAWLDPVSVDGSGRLEIYRIRD